MATEIYSGSLRVKKSRFTQYPLCYKTAVCSRGKLLISSND